MAQRKTTAASSYSTPDYLVKPKIDFEEILNSRIALGDKLWGTQISNQQEYIDIQKSYDDWHDYNKEMLSRYFNKIDNKYHRDYTYEPNVGMSIHGIGAYSAPPPSFQQITASLKARIEKHLNRLKLIKSKLDLIDELPGLQPAQATKLVSKQEEGLNYLSTIFSKFNRVAQHLRHRHADRETIIIKDEYDVQDLLHSLLHLHFSDIRAEDYSPSYAGGNSRVDFTLKDEKIVVEVKMTNDHLKDKEIGNQLLIDIGRYRGHPDCEVLAVFVYDKLDNIRNKAGLIADLEKMSTPSLKVCVFIEPKY